MGETVWETIIRLISFRPSKSQEGRWDRWSEDLPTEAAHQRPSSSTEMFLYLFHKLPVCCRCSLCLPLSLSCRHLSHGSSGKSEHGQKKKKLTDYSTGRRMRMFFLGSRVNEEISVVHSGRSVIVNLCN